MKRYDCLRVIAPHFDQELVVTNIGAVRLNGRPSDLTQVIFICRTSD